MPHSEPRTTADQFQQLVKDAAEAGIAINAAQELPSQLTWQRHDAPHYRCEFAWKGDGSIIYHFFPPEGEQQFIGEAGEEFAKLLENAFKEVCRDDDDVRASFISFEEDAAKMILMAGEKEDSERKPQSSFDIRVMKAAERSQSKYIFQQLLFERLNLQISPWSN